jgi:DUF4097 and DUF4098 domain-containing protein YvlB
MKSYWRTGLIAVLAISVLYAGVCAKEKGEVDQTFENIERISLKTVSGNCLITKGERDVVTLNIEYSYYPEDSFEPGIKVRGSTLKLSERMLESNSGSSEWILTVPDGIEIEFSSASGDMEVEGVKGTFRASTASGDIELENCTGDFEISTASGDIVVDDCRGEFQLSTASGTVEAIGVILDEESSFSTASGRVDVVLAESAAYDLEIGSASGSATLDYGGNPINGTFKFESKVRGGRISSPIDFDDEVTFRKWDDRYVRKTFTRGSETPVISIGTATGRAVLKEG